MDASRGPFTNTYNDLGLSDDEVSRIRAGETVEVQDFRGDLYLVSESGSDATGWLSRTTRVKDEQTKD